MTEKKLKQRIKDLELLLEFAGVPLMIIKMPDIVLQDEKYKLWKKNLKK